jgi:hypothetical protein
MGTVEESDRGRAPNRADDIELDAPATTCTIAATIAPAVAKRP